MNSRRLVLRSLVHHRRTHLGALLTAALVAAVVVAALGVGDSVRSAMALASRARIGDVRFAAHAPDRRWRAELSKSLGRDLGATASAALILNASLARPDGSARIGIARALGVDDDFWALSPAGRPPLSPWPEDGVAVSESAAARLRLSIGDRLAIRVERPAGVPSDLRTGSGPEATAVLLVEVAAVLDAASFGSFSLRIDPVPPANVFLPLGRLARAVGDPGSANTLLVAGGEGEEGRVRAALAAHLRLEDLGLSLRPVEGGRRLELRSRRVLLEAAAAKAALELPGASGVLAWLVNDLRAGERHTPYSMVAALPPDGELIPADLGRDGIVVNRWLADDLGAGPGDTVALTYFVLPDSGPPTERTTEFRVRAVVPIAGRAADRDLMPEFPGISGSRSCRDWDPGFRLDLSRIRDRDEKYWEEHGGTPKAFVSLPAGRELWGNRFGDLTAVRFAAGADPAAVESALRDRLDPGAFGLSFADLRAAAAAAGREGSDFGALFLGFSGLLTVAALLLLALVVALNVDMRRGEIATLLALGFTRRRVRRLFATEHALVAVGGGILGVAGGIALEAAALAALGSVWKDVAGSLPMVAVLRPGTLAAGAFGGALVSLAAAGLVLWRAVGRPDAAPGVRIARGRGFGAWAGPALALAAVVLAALAGTGRDPATAGAFFGSGLLLFAAALSFLWAALARLGVAGEGRRPTARGLAWRNLGRRRGRSVATVGVLAFGVFMFLGVSVFRRDRLTRADDPASGTGGFALLGESSVAVVKDLDSPEGRRFFALPDAALEGVRVVGLRVRAGDDASCLGLARAQTPEVVGVDPEALRGRFTFVRVEGDGGDPWDVLSAPAGDGAVPAVVDQATLWTLGRGFGDRIALEDGQGRPFPARIAGVIDNAVLHGRLVVGEGAFVRLYPAEEGYRRFLIDAPAARTDEVAALLTRQMADFGLSLERAEVRQNALNAVENTYLGIFTALGGIGLLLGSAGLALVVARNVLERRGELALLAAVGFAPGMLVRLLTREHAALLFLGLAAGLGASALSLLPALLSPGARIFTPATAGVLAALVAGGLLWTRLAVRIALRGPLLANLREE